jgi:8-oxo-dGTP diphosphatase
VIVVAAAVVRGGRVLAAHRRVPVGWEFPGGKVDAGETDHAALRRECQEELGVDVRVGPLLGRTPIGAEVELRLYLAAVVAGEPAPLLDHDELRWFAISELDELPWLPADRALLGNLPLPLP